MRRKDIKEAIAQVRANPDRVSEIVGQTILTRKARDIRDYPGQDAKLKKFLPGVVRHDDRGDQARLQTDDPPTDFKYRGVSVHGDAVEWVTYLGSGESWPYMLRVAVIPEGHPSETYYMAIEIVVADTMTPLMLDTVEQDSTVFKEIMQITSMIDPGTKKHLVLKSTEYESKRLQGDLNKIESTLTDLFGISLTKLELHQLEMVRLGSYA